MEKKLFYTITKKLPQHGAHTSQLIIHVKSKEKNNPEQITFTWSSHYKYNAWFGCQSRLGQGIQNLFALFPLLSLLNKIDKAALTSGTGAQEVIDLLEANNIEHAIEAEISNEYGERYDGFITEKEIRDGELERDGCRKFKISHQHQYELVMELMEAKSTKNR